jgi:hypothetical protein
LITDEGFDFPDNCSPFPPLSNSWSASLPAKYTEARQINVSEMAQYITCKCTCDNGIVLHQFISLLF